MENEQIIKNIIKQMDFIDIFYFMSFRDVWFCSDEIANNLCSITLLNYYGNRDKTIFATSLNVAYRKALWFLIKEKKIKTDDLLWRSK